MKLVDRCSSSLCEVLTYLHEQKAKVYLVGGCVRDHLLGIVPKDFDIEVYGLPEETLYQCLKTFGQCDLIGKQFGIYKLFNLPEADFALPRKEVQVGDLHRDFEIEVDPWMDIKDACRRRDFTMNAILYDPFEDCYIDPYDGQKDIKAGLIRAVDPHTFKEDPLRVYRLAQFVARTEFQVEEKTRELCRELVLDKRLKSLSKERIRDEYTKLLMAKKPSLGFVFMQEVGMLHPLLEALIQTHQRPDYHPEGTAWVHTLLVLDQASQVKQHTSNPLGFMLSALLHDVGKPETTDDFGHAIGHEVIGEKRARQFVREIYGQKKLENYVAINVYCHLKLMVYAKNHVHDKTYLKFLALIDGKTTLNDLYYLTMCDARGCKTDVQHSLYALDRFMQDYPSRLGWVAPKPVVSGSDIMALGVRPGPQVKELLQAAYDLQLGGHQRSGILKVLRRRLDDGAE